MKLFRLYHSEKKNVMIVNKAPTANNASSVNIFILVGFMAVEAMWAVAQIAAGIAVVALTIYFILSH